MKFGGLADKEINLKTRKSHFSLIPIPLHKFSGFDGHLIFEKLVNMAVETDIEFKNVILAKTSETYTSVKKTMFKIIGFFQTFK